MIIFSILDCISNGIRSPDLFKTINLMASSDAKSLKRIPQKKHFPFGTPTNKFHPFSEFQHLKPEDVLLYKALSANEGEFKAEIFTGDEITSKTSPKKKKVAPIKIDTDILKDIPNVPAGVEPCKRIDCKNVIKNILESQSRNSIERDELMLDIENHLAEYQSSERENAAMENKLDHANRLTSQLEATLQHLNAQIDRLEGKKIELQQEKEELGNKVSNSYYTSDAIYHYFHFNFIIGDGNRN